MTTLRRELIHKFQDILIPALNDNFQTQDAESFGIHMAVLLADAALELRAFQFKQKDQQNDNPA